ncbi:hypothetical protein C7B67_26765 [filamentous cyanobacterium Phorm 6]|nr:hypothetical protein C7B67_26765 [filamentous cyanobacterium Phorm 6]
MNFLLPPLTKGRVGVGSKSLRLLQGLLYSDTNGIDMTRNHADLNIYATLPEIADFPLLEKQFFQ